MGAEKSKSLLKPPKATAFLVKLHILIYFKCLDGKQLIMSSTGFSKVTQSVIKKKEKGFRVFASILIVPQTKN